MILSFSYSYLILFSIKRFGSQKVLLNSIIVVLLSGCHGGMVQWFSRKKPYNGYRVAGFSWQPRAVAFANVGLAVTVRILWKKQQLPLTMVISILRYMQVISQLDGILNSRYESLVSIYFKYESHFEFRYIFFFKNPN
jgi:hypothetical protein